MSQSHLHSLLVLGVVFGCTAWYRWLSAHHRVTHASNKNTHPGMPDIDEEVLNRPKLKPRRTKAQIAAENAAAAEKKSVRVEEVKLNNEKKAKLIDWIATLEAKMCNEEQQAEREAAHPPVKKMVVLDMNPPSICTNTHLFKCAMQY